MKTLTYQQMLKKNSEEFGENCYDKKEEHVNYYFGMFQTLFPHLVNTTVIKFKS